MCNVQSVNSCHPRILRNNCANLHFAHNIIYLCTRTCDTLNSTIVDVDDGAYVVDVCMNYTYSRNFFLFSFL